MNKTFSLDFFHTSPTSFVTSYQSVLQERLDQGQCGEWGLPPTPLSFIGQRDYRGGQSSLSRLPAFMLFMVLTHDCLIPNCQVANEKSVVAPNCNKDEAVYNGGGTADELVSLNFDKTKEMVVDLPRRLTAHTLPLHQQLCTRWATPGTTSPGTSPLTLLWKRTASTLPAQTKESHSYATRPYHLRPGHLHHSVVWQSDITKTKDGG